MVNAPDTRKTCPRCGTLFVCRAGAVTSCQCQGVELSQVQQSLIAAQYNGCLCRDCLVTLREAHLPPEQDNP